MTQPDPARRPPAPTDGPPRPAAYPGPAAAPRTLHVVADCPLCERPVSIPGECCFHLFRHAEGQPGSVDILCRWPAGVEDCPSLKAMERKLRGGR